MIEVKVKNLANDRSYGGAFETLEEAEAWIAKQEVKGSWGKPEREVHEDDMTEFEKKRVKTKRKEDKDKPKWICQVKADYEIEIWQASAYKQKRAAEYPSKEIIIEALIENMEMRPQKLNEVKKWREQVRNKYPKDSAELLEKR